jgi:hypothetical protein
MEFLDIMEKFTSILCLLFCLKPKFFPILI